MNTKLQPLVITLLLDHKENRMIFIHASEKGLSFDGDTGTALALVNNLRHAYELIDMPKILSDFVFNIEVQLQNAGVLDEWFNEVKA